MSFHAYLNNIKTKTGKEPRTLQNLQNKKDLLKMVS